MVRRSERFGDSLSNRMKGSRGKREELLRKASRLDYRFMRAIVGLEIVDHQSLELLFLCEIKGWTYAAIGALYGWSKKETAEHIFRVRETLYEKLNPKANSNHEEF